MRLVVCLTILMLSGCAGLPKSVDEFQTRGIPSRELRTAKPVKETFELLRAQSIKCYQRQAVVPAAGVEIQQGTIVETGSTPQGGHWIALAGYSGWLRFYQQLIELASRPDGTTTVKVYEVNTGWQSATERVSQWLEDKPGSKCPL